MDESMSPQIRFTVVRGEPDDLELAALTAVLLARLRAGDPAGGEPGEHEEPAPRAPWGTPRRHRPRVGWTAHL
jgi:hypothetical protein